VPPLLDDLECQPVVAHADGRLVTEANPARAGETLVLYAYGLGWVPGVKTGEAAPKEPRPVGSPLTTVWFDFTVDAPPRNPYGGGSVPAFVGLAPGYVGLYQVNFVVPAPPAGHPPCGYTENRGVRTNLTVNVVAAWERFVSDGGGICVATADAAALSSGAPAEAATGAAAPFLPNFMPLPGGADARGLGR
jgi:hypothetical protein